MKVLVVSDSFKESLSSAEIADAIEEGIIKSKYEKVEVIKIPVADGGEGTIEAILKAIDGELVRKKVFGPLGEEINAYYAISKDKKVAVVEVAQAIGLNLLPYEKRNPIKTTSVGVGQLIHDAIDLGAKKIIIGLGGSSTNDGGAGMMYGLGAEFITHQGEKVCPQGGNIGIIKQINIHTMLEKIKGIKFVIASDVNNPLIGEQGATRIFAPQKGATVQMVEELENNMKQYATLINTMAQKDIGSEPGAGAAGGIGAALIAFFNASFQSGIEMIIQMNDIENYIQKADLIITGEGKIDMQTQYGKLPMGITKIASKYKKIIVGIAGQLGEGSETMIELGMDRLYCITPEKMPLEQALNSAYANVVNTARKIIEDYKFL